MIARFVPESSVKGTLRFLSVPRDSGGCLFLARRREVADEVRDRVSKLGAHFGQASEDVRQILISAEKVEKRGTRIRDVEFDGDEQPSADILPGPGPRKLEAGE